MKKFHSFLDRNFSGTIFTYQEVFKMLLPLILDMFFINIISMLTTSMISSSSQESVAAVSCVNPIATLVLCLLNAVAAGGTVVVAQYKGKGEADKIGETAGQTIFITSLISVCFCSLMIIFSNGIINFLYSSAEPLVKAKAVEYLIGVSVSLIVFSLYSSIFAIFRGLGETSLCLKLTIYINVSYFIFSIILVNYMALDIKGTYLSLILARILGAGVCVYYLFLKKNRLIEIGFKDIFHINPSLFASMLKISIPFGAEQLFFYGGSILVQKYLVELGTAAVAANAIGTSMFGLAYAAPYAVGNLATTIIGQCVGAGKKDEARKYGKNFVWLGTALVLISLLIFIPLIPWLLNFFHPEAETIPVIKSILWLVMIPMPFIWPVSNITPYTLRSAGDATYSSVVSLITMWLIRVGAGYVAAIPMGYGIYGVWVCMALEWLVRTVLFQIRFQGEAWLNKKTI